MPHQHFRSRHGNVNLRPGHVRTSVLGSSSDGTAPDAPLEAQQQVIGDDIAEQAITANHLQVGAITLYDEFGEAVLTPAGWSGSWQNFNSIGLYNGMLASGINTTLPDGRTVALPYWTVSRTSVSVPCVAVRQDDALFPGGKAVHVTWGATDESLTFTADPVSVVGSFAYLLEIDARIYGGLTALTHVRFDAYVDWYDASGVLISTANVNSGQTDGSIPPETYGPGPGFTYPFQHSVAVAPDNAATVVVRVVAAMSGTYSSAAYLDFGLASLTKVPNGLSDFGSYSVGSLNVVDWLTPVPYTPSIGGDGTATWSVKQGYYLNLGAMVFVSVELTVATVGTGGGTITVGLPYEVGTQDVILSGYSNGMAAGFAQGPVSGLANIGAFEVAVVRDAGNVTLTRSLLAVGGVVRLTGMYWRV